MQFSAWYVLFALQLHYSFVPNFPQECGRVSVLRKSECTSPPSRKATRGGKRQIYRRAYRSSSNFFFMFSGTGNEKRRTLRKPKRKWGTKDVTFLAGDDFTRARVISSTLPPYGKWGIRDNLLTRGRKLGPVYCFSWKQVGNVGGGGRGLD